VWQYVSIRAKDFINRILRTPKRLSALTAMTHPWLYDKKKRAPGAENNGQKDMSLSQQVNASLILQQLRTSSYQLRVSKQQ
jgi:hypothetical protein